MTLKPANADLTQPSRDSDSKGKAGPSNRSSWCRILQKQVPSVAVPSNEPETSIFGSPEVEAINWAVTRRCATTGSRVKPI